MSLTKLSESSLLSNLQNKNILIIGGTAGIGKALALSLIKRNSNITIVGRRTPSEDILSKVTFVKKDLTLLKDAVSLYKDIDFENLILLYLLMVYSVEMLEKKQMKELN